MSAPGKSVTPGDPLRTLLDRSPDMVFRYRIVAPLGFVWVSAAAFRVTGYTAEQFLGDPELWLRLLDQDDPIAELAQRLPTMDPDHLPDHLDLTILDATGGRRNVEVDLAVERDDEGQPIAVDGVIRDVTERVLRERQAALSISSLAAVVEHAAEAIFTVDHLCTVLTWNAGAERLLGIPAADAIGRRGPLVLGDEERQALRDRCFRDRESLTLGDAQFLAGDGSRIPVSISMTPIVGADGQVRELSVIARDERPRQETERELRFRESVLDAVEDAVLATEPDGRIVFWSRGAERMTGVPGADAVGRLVADVILPAATRAMRADLVVRVNRSLPIREDVEIARSDGTVLVGDLATTAITGPEGRGLRLAVIRDVTASRAAARDLSRLAAIVDAASELIFSMDHDAVVRSWNPGAAKALGYEPSEVIGRTIALLVEPSQLPAAIAFHERVTRAGEAAVTGELDLVARDGSKVPVQVTLSPIREATGRVTGAAVIAQDQRRRRAVEEQLRQAKKLDAVGRLTSGIAHDFNNLLTAVTGYGSLLLAELPEPSPAAADARQILQAADRAAELTRSLLALSSGTRQEPQLILVDALVETLEPSLRGLVPDGVILRVDAASGAPVLLDPTELELALVNLVVNSGEAMTGGGRVEVTTRAVGLDAAFAEAHLGVMPGPHVEVVVRDTGPGLPAEVVEHLYEPFVTTKMAGTGAGLGLATVHAYVERAGGTIWASSETGRGTTFRILLPRAPGMPAGADPRRRPAASGGIERILLVEDDTQVRTLATTILGRAGYRLTVRGDSRHALDVDPASVDLLVSDVLMPHLDGPSLAAALLERRPDLPVLFMSGFADRTDMEELTRWSRRPLLAKPFGPADLLAAVRQALDAAVPDGG